MIDASFMYNISFFWIIWCLTKRQNCSFQWCFYFALGYLNPPSWTELNGICQKKSITQPVIHSFEVDPQLPTFQFVPRPCSMPSHVSAVLPVLCTIFAVFCQKCTTLRTSCFFLRTSIHKNLIDIPWYTAVKNWPFFTRWIQWKPGCFPTANDLCTGKQKDLLQLKSNHFVKVIFLGNLSWISKTWFILRTMFLLQEDIRSLYLLGFSLFVFFGDGSERLVDSIYYPSWN